ncbi:MAG: BamA/TamA family outer membrane protein [Flavobacteriaceae bacterium]|nr:BamA/TamA family outer membrane protein [Flavobacteriaceae bacterium]
MKKKLFFIGIFLIGISYVFSQEKPKMFRDSLDNAFDISTFILGNNGILPLVIPITEPAVGFGAVAGGAYFLKKKKPGQKEDIIALMGGLTTNGTWLVGGAYMGFWNKDKVRYRGVIGYGDMTLNFYDPKGESFEFNMQAFMFLQQANFRIGNSDFFLGGKYQLSVINIPIFAGNEFIDPIDLELRNSGVSLIAEYDNLNNTFSPTDGLRVHLSYDQNFELLGSTKNWGKLNFFTHWYFPVNEKWIPALRLESSLATGDTPFYALPFVALRGIPALRYQGDLTFLAETEQLYNITPRWGLLGFTGIGTAIKSLDNSNLKNDVVWNAGGGFRYLLARKLGLKMGMDIARGPEDWAFYITVGTGWLK